MLRLLLFILIASGFAAPAGHAAGMGKLSCVSSWPAGQYKTYRQVQSDIKNRFGHVRILKVALCGQDTHAYFHVVVMTNRGVVQTLRIDAK